MVKSLMKLQQRCKSSHIYLTLLGYLQSTLAALVARAFEVKR